MNANILKSPDELARDTQKTRAEIDATLAALEERLSPDEIIGHVGRALVPARDGAARFAENFGGAVRDNPIPASLMAVSLGWLLVAGRHGVGHGAPGSEIGPENYRMDPHRPDSASTMPTETPDMEGTMSIDRNETHGIRESVDSDVRDARNWARRRADQASDQLHHSADEAYRRTSDASYRAGARVHRKSSAAADFVRERPLLTGLVVAGLGAVVAATIFARTERGRDAISHGTRAVRDGSRRMGAQVRSQADELSKAASDAVSDAKTHVKETAGRTREGATNVRDAVASKTADARDSAQQKAQQAMSAAEDTLRRRESETTNTDKETPRSDTGMQARTSAVGMQAHTSAVGVQTRTSADGSPTQPSAKDMPFPVKPIPVTPAAPSPDAGRSADADPVNPAVTADKSTLHPTSAKKA